MVVASRCLDFAILRSLLIVCGQVLGPMFMTTDDTEMVHKEVYGACLGNTHTPTGLPRFAHCAPDFTLQIQKWVQLGDTWLCSSIGKAGDDKNGNATTAIKLEEAEELNCGLKDGQGSTFSVRSMLKKIRWPPTKQQFKRDIVAMRKDTSVQEKEKDRRWVLSSGDPKTITIRTPVLVVRICINNLLHIVKNNHELQDGSCTNVCKRSAERTKKTRTRSSKQRLPQELSPGQESSMKKKSLCQTQVHLWIHLWIS